VAVTSIALAVSNLTLGIGAALVLGGVVLFMTYGKQFRESIAWIMEMYRSAKGQQLLEEESSNAEGPVEELDKDEIAEIKEQISTLSKQTKSILVDIKKTRDAELLKAIEGDANIVITDYAMKWEFRKAEFDKAVQAMEAATRRMPEQALAYRQDTIAWIARARKKCDKCSPEELVRKIRAANKG